MNFFTRRSRLAVLFVLAALLFMQAAAAVLNSPAFVWNDVRLARSVALSRGFSLYLAKNAAGPVIGTLHTPVSHFIYLPATGFHNPSNALLAGSSISLLLTLAPLGWILWRARAGQPGRFSNALAAFLFAGFLILEAPGTYHTATMIHVDAAAIAFVTLACGSFSNPCRAIRANQAWLAGLFCVMAVASKQTIAPIVPALALFLWLAAGFKTFVHFSAAFLTGGLAMLGAIAALGSWQGFFFNTVTLASHRPLKDGYFEILVRTFGEGKLHALPALVPMLFLLARYWPSSKRRTDFREFVRANRWMAFVLAAIALIPVTAKAVITVGADVNHLGILLYMLFAGSALAIQQCLTDPDNAFVRAGGWLGLVLGILYGAAPGSLASLPSRLREIHQNPTEAAWRYALRHPGRAYFPSNPLPDLLAEDKLYHVDFSLYDRELAGYPLTPVQFAAALPRQFTMLAIPPGQNVWSNLTRGLLANCQPVTDVELPGWTVYERAPSCTEKSMVNACHPAQTE